MNEIARERLLNGSRRKREGRRRLTMNENETEKTGLRENDRTRVEEILGEGDEIKTQERAKTKKA